MQFRSLVFLLSVTALAVFGLPECSNDGDTNPGPVVVDMFGYLDFPAGEAVSPEEVTVGFGDYEVAPDSEGTFIISGNEGAPGLAMACTEDSVILLMAIVPDPQGELAFGLDAASTALALAFLNPFVCVNDPDDAEEVLDILGDLPELADLEDLLETKLEADPEAIGKDDPEIDAALSAVVLAYINSFPAPMARNYSAQHTYADGPGAPAAEPEVVVDPGYPVSGHHLTHIEDDRFNITNARGRWAYCVTPVDSFYLFPNGTLLDALKGSLWAPSNREFRLSLTPNGDTLEVRVYGAGFSSEAGNTFNTLNQPRAVPRDRRGRGDRLLRVSAADHQRDHQQHQVHLPQRHRKRRSDVGARVSADSANRRPYAGVLPGRRLAGIDLVSRSRRAFPTPSTATTSATSS